MSLRLGDPIARLQPTLLESNQARSTFRYGETPLLVRGEVRHTSRVDASDSEDPIDLHCLILGTAKAEHAEFMQQIDALRGLIIGDCRDKRNANVPFSILHPWIYRIRGLGTGDAVDELILIQHEQSALLSNDDIGKLVELKCELRRYDNEVEGKVLSVYAILGLDVAFV
ncbi:hypothetical protein C8J57DRAFT_1538584 [Mycena rebaudengoi]|nr:hypothetical protein C8J57DRAFT_1538584 [Mycena rebaudengoi]